MQVQERKIISQTINNLRFPLTVGVVFIHFSLIGGLNINGNIYGLENPGWYFFVTIFISEVLSRLCVPLFFVISGFLFFNRKVFDKDVYLFKIKSRIHTLLIPYILWNAIAILWQLKCFLPGLSVFYRPVEIQFSLSRVINTFFCNTYNKGIFVSATTGALSDGIYPIDTPLWYVRELMVMVLFSPLIYFAIKKWRGGVIAVGIMWIVAPVIFAADSYISMIITALFFFSIGAYFGVFNKNIFAFAACRRFFKYSPILYLSIAIVDALSKGNEYNIFVHRIGILFGIIAVLSTASYLLKSGAIGQSMSLADSSFFIFALHNIFIKELGKIIFVLLHIPDNNPYVMIVFYFTVPLISIALCFSIYVILKKYMPKFCGILTGGR